MGMRITKLHLLTVMTAFALSACAETAQDETAMADSTAVAGDSAAQNAPPMEPQVTGLDDVNDSGISGEATATHSANDATVSILLKDGAKPDVTYPAHIHSGNCKDGGPVVVELEAVKNLQSTKTIPVGSIPRDQPLFVQVHDAGGKPVACGDMKGHDGDSAGRDTTHNTTTTH
jgi:hypothetical protein